MTIAQVWSGSLLIEMFAIDYGDTRCEHGHTKGDGDGIDDTLSWRAIHEGSGEGYGDGTIHGNGYAVMDAEGGGWGGGDHHGEWGRMFYTLS